MNYIIVEDPLVCNTIGATTFLGCANRSVADVFADVSNWSSGAGTRQAVQATPTSPGQDAIGPDETLKRAQNIATTNKRHIYVGVYIALVVLLVILVIRAL